MHRFFMWLWYSGTPWAYLLWPLSLLFRLLAFFRRGLYGLGLLRRHAFPVPVIVVGNISVGGTGKTPVVLWLLEVLKAQGYRPGVVSRGYGGQGRGIHWVHAQAHVDMVGDEAILLQRRSGCPMVVGRQRVAAIDVLLKQTTCDVVVCDDGLQHYALKPALTLAVLDGVRRFGNGMCLPAGPLRELPGRLNSVGFVICQGQPHAGEWAMQLTLDAVYPLEGGQSPRALEDFRGQQLHAVAAIGHPQRFFTALKQAGLDIIPHSFPDHHRFQSGDLDFGSQALVLMTEKDAVKCRQFAQPGHWVVLAETQIHRGLAQRILWRLGHGLAKGRRE